jgi:hypothetical protein
MLSEQQEENQYMRLLQQELREAEIKNKQQSNLIAQASGFNFPSEDNLIRFQLDLKEDIDRLYHLLKGHQLRYDAKGNYVYVEPDEDSLKPFNEFGVQLIMNIMSFYLNRNTLLSNYDEDTIYWKVLDFGNEISDLILCRYKEMGMNTPEKIKLYPIVVRELVDTVHSAYLRSLDGGERESLRTARTVTQSENPLMLNNQMMQNQNKKFSVFKPTTWI